MSDFTSDGAPRVTAVTGVRRIRVAATARHRLNMYMAHKPATARRLTTATVTSYTGRHRVATDDGACLHPGVFAQNPAAYAGVADPAEHCWMCDQDIPVEEL